jgi:transposase
VIHETALEVLVEQAGPQLLDEFGIGTVIAAQIIVSWSHPGRCRNEAAFARLAGVAPIEATSGQTQNRHRLNRGGDRQLNRALHQVIITRTRTDEETKAYIAKRISEGKTKREARRCLKRYLSRHLYRILENPPNPT